MLRQTIVQLIFTLVVSVSYARHVAFAPSHAHHQHASPITSRARATPKSLSGTSMLANGVRVRASERNPRQINTSSLNALTSPLSSLSLDVLTPSFLFPSIITSYEGDIPEYQSNQAFQDEVSLSDLTSDPVLQIAFAAAAVAIVLLFAAKAIVTQLDEAVQKTALDFDRVMKLKYPKKWSKFIEEDDGESDILGEESEADRIQRIVEEMEILSKEEPQFMERVMQDVERMQQ